MSGQNSEILKDNPCVNHLTIGSMATVFCICRQNLSVGFFVWEFYYCYLGFFFQVHHSIKPSYISTRTETKQSSLTRRDTRTTRGSLAEGGAVGAGPPPVPSHHYRQRLLNNHSISVFHLILSVTCSNVVSILLETGYI